MFVEEIHLLEAQLAELGGVAEKSVELAEMVMARRRVNVDALILNEEESDRRYQLLDQKCLEILAMFHPKADQLRFIFSAIKVNRDLEQISTQSVSIGFYCLEHGKDWPLKVREELIQLSQQARLMLHESVNSMIRRDRRLADSVFLLEEEFDQCRRELLELACRSQKSGHVSAVLTAHSFKRISELAVSIAEHVIFAVTGQTVYGAMETSEMNSPGSIGFNKKSKGSFTKAFYSS